MKARKLIILLAAAAALLLSAVSCDVHEFPEGESSVAVTLWLSFTQDIPQYRTLDYGTKAYKEGYSARYILRLYKYTSDTWEREPAYTFVAYNDNLSVLDRLEVIHVEAANYHVLVWTDFVPTGTTDDFLYDTQDFSEVMFKDPYSGADIMRDCFFGSTDLMLAEYLTYDAQYAADAIRMSRPVARYELISTDADKFVDYWVQQLAIRSGSFVKPDRSTIHLNDFHVRFIYPQFLPNTFNVHTEAPVDSRTGIRFDTQMQVREDGSVYLGFDWMFANRPDTESKVIVSLELYDQDWQYISTVSNLEVPMMRGQNTTFIGNILTSGISGGVSIDPTYDGEFTIHI